MTTEVDGVPHRVLRTPFVDRLVRGGVAARVGSLPRAVRNAVGFRRLSKTPWRQLVREGVSMHRSQELSWSQVVMAANTPMLLKAAMVHGQTDLGVMASGQVVGLIEDLPSCAELIARIMGEAAEVLDRLLAPGPSVGAGAGDRRGPGTGGEV